MALTVYQAHVKALAFWRELKENPDLTKVQLAAKLYSIADIAQIKDHSCCWLCTVNRACENCALASHGVNSYTCESIDQPYDLWKSAQNTKNLLDSTKYAGQVCQRITTWLINNSAGVDMKYFVINNEDQEVEEYKSREEVEAYINGLMNDSDTYERDDFRVIRGTEIDLLSKGVCLEEED